MTIKGYKQTPEHIAKRSRSGKSHHAWLGDGVSAKGGRTRANRLYPNVGPCSTCGAPRAERHHKDGNTANNDISNIAVLCRRCHMDADGRLERAASLCRAIQPIGVRASRAKRRGEA